jgi:hypothetical protein
MLSDRVFYPTCAALAVLMVALALVWPQGEGARSPWPFGHTATMPSWVAAQKRRDEMRARRNKPLRPAIAAATTALAKVPAITPAKVKP